jgi:hypothetical protein
MNKIQGPFGLHTSNVHDKIYNLISCHSDAIFPSYLKHVKRNVMQVICLNSPVNRPVDPKQIATEIINTPAFSL